MKSTVRKRNDTGKWVMCTMVEGKRYIATLGHGSQRWAQREGDMKLAEMLEDAAMGNLHCTVDNLLKLWERYGQSGQSRKGQLRDTSIVQARNAFMDVCSMGGKLDRTNMLEEVTPQVVRAWHVEELKKKTVVSGQRRMASLYAKWVKAKSVFGKQAVTFYADNGLDIAEWARVMRDVSLPRGRVPAYDLPPDDLVQRVETEGAKLKDTKPHLWVVYTLGINCGLRAAEIASMRKSWVMRCRGTLVIELIEREDEGFKPKHGSERMVPIHDELWKDICKLSEGYETVLPGNYNHRYEIVTREFAKWMKDLGWTRRKKAHELRKLFGSRIYTDLDPATARDRLGHESYDTTTRYYAKLDKPFELLPPR